MGLGKVAGHIPIFIQSSMQRGDRTSPFELATGQQPLTPHTLAAPRTEERNPGAFIMVRQWEEHADQARVCLEKSRKRMKKWADEKRQPLEYSVGDLVLVKPLPQTVQGIPKPT